MVESMDDLKREHEELYITAKAKEFQVGLYSDLRKRIDKLLKNVGKRYDKNLKDIRDLIDQQKLSGHEKRKLTRLRIEQSKLTSWMNAWVENIESRAA
jgi:hypothetical protein